MTPATRLLAAALAFVSFAGPIPPPEVRMGACRYIGSVGGVRRP